MLRWPTYFLILAGSGLAALAVFFVSLIWRGDISIAGCNPSKLSSQVFMAYCDQKAYADYEHGAFYFGIEPQAVANLKAAEVVFSGNSRLQYAFSTAATERYFAARGIRYYLAGFGYGESYGFFTELVKRHQLRPAVVIVNGNHPDNPYFSEGMSRPAEDTVRRDNLDVILQVLIKKLLQLWHRASCGERPDAARDECGGPQGTINRSVLNGSWPYRELYKRDVGRSAIYRPERKPVNIEAYLPSAQKFANILQMPRECIVLTSVPANDIWPGPLPEAEIARRMGFTLIAPPPVEIATMDGLHLSSASAERWSAAFLSELQPVLDRCLKGGAARRAEIAADPLEEAYWNRYPDVAADPYFGRGSKLGAAEHYRRHGKAEGRIWGLGK